MSIRIALAGNPNSGKTSLFNRITGAMQKVGNWGGVTVDTKEGTATIQHEKVNVVDLPGTYSLSTLSEEELVARNFIVDYREGAGIRIAPHFYNTDDEIRLTMQTIADILDDGSWSQHAATRVFVT